MTATRRYRYLLVQVCESLCTARATFNYLLVQAVRRPPGRLTAQLALSRSFSYNAFTIVSAIRLLNSGLSK